MNVEAAQAAARKLEEVTAEKAKVETALHENDKERARLLARARYLGEERDTAMAAFLNGLSLTIDDLPSQKFIEDYAKALKHRQVQGGAA